MCGICGQINFNGSPVDRGKITAMMGALSHRGPDDDGIYIKENGQNGPAVGLGHQRLSIIDLSKAGHQPMSNTEGTTWIVYNGEIYNFPTLRSELDSLGYPFRSRSDTEVLLAAYEKWGLDFLKKLNGMFAFAIWDERKRRLLMARDHVGIKPLFFSYDSDRLVFGSELKSLAKAPGAIGRINLFSLQMYLTLGYIPAPLSIFESVYKLPPAHYLIWEDGSLRLERYWSLDMQNKVHLKDEGEYAEMLREKLSRAVKSQLISDVPLGAFLSGGVDSSAIVAMMAEGASKPVKTFSIGFDGMGMYDERAFAAEVSKRFQTEHQEFVVQPDAVEILPKVCEFIDEPFADTSSIPTFYLSELARKHVTVILSGTGGDDIFAGYHRYAAHRVHYLFRKFPSPMKKILETFAKFLPGSRKHLPGELILYFQRFCKTLSMSDERAYLNLVSVFPPGEWNKLTGRSEKDVEPFFEIDPMFGAPLGRGEKVFSHLFDREKEADLLDRLLYVDYHTYLPDDLLVKEDRMTMAHGLEGRVPFLDKEMVEMAASIPSKIKLKKLTTKYILKKSVEPLLSRKIVHRRKHGFAVPVSEWFRNELKDLVMDELVRKPDRFFQKKAVEKLWEEHKRGIDHGDRLWTLLVFEIWRDRLGGT